MTTDYTSLANLARCTRAHVLCMTHKGKASHVATCLSMVELLTVLYTRTLRVDPGQPGWPERDRFILSKGHGGAALFAMLAKRCFFPLQWLDTYYQDGSRLPGHITHWGVPGVEVSTGSLGHGLSMGCGMSLVGKRAGKSYRVFVLLSDGECDEGSVWEAALFAPHHGLDNLVAIVDYNKMQALGRVKEVLNLESLAARADLVVAGDFSTDALKRVKERYQQRAEIVVLDAHQFPYRKDSFDTIAVMEIIQYLQAERFLDECQRVLKKGGVLVLCIPNPDVPGFYRSPVSTRYYSAPELFALLSQRFDTRLYGDFPIPERAAEATWRSLRRTIISSLGKALDHIPKVAPARAFLYRRTHSVPIVLKEEIEEGDIITDNMRLTPISSVTSDRRHQLLYAVACR